MHGITVHGITVHGITVHGITVHGITVHDTRIQFNNQRMIRCIRFVFIENEQSRVNSWNINQVVANKKQCLPGGLLSIASWHACRYCCIADLLSNTVVPRDQLSRSAIFARCTVEANAARICIEAFTTSRYRTNECHVSSARWSRNESKNDEAVTVATTRCHNTT